MNEKEILHGKVLIYIHIPKTAGTTLLAIMHRQFPITTTQGSGKTPRERIDVIKQLRSLTDEEKRQARFVCGHVEFGIHRLFDKEAIYTTFLRHPGERIISGYYAHHTGEIGHLKNKYRKRLEEKYKLTDHDRQVLKWIEYAPETFSLEDYVHHQAVLGFTNVQTRAISGIDNLNINVPPLRPLPNDALYLAKRNIELYFSSIGTVEQFDESLIEMALTFGWRNVYYNRRNVTRHRPAWIEIPGHIRKQIENMNTIDFELYEFVCARLKSRIKKKGDIFNKKFQRFKCLNLVMGSLSDFVHWRFMLDLGRKKIF